MSENTQSLIEQQKQEIERLKTKNQELQQKIKRLERRRDSLREIKDFLAQFHNQGIGDTKILLDDLKVFLKSAVTKIESFEQNSKFLQQEFNIKR